MEPTACPPVGEDRDRPPYEPRLHDVVEDTAAGKVGKVMGHVGPYMQLRPIGGGLEWEADPGSLRPVTTAQALSAGVAIANARSRGECP
ncbi:hypothetical protein [Streptomyces sp. Amel2xC10]|uniref:hypothetical protein n=1 Tax=Streptomyces sp. Amel2xC10 TaxID=1305826 RepID=UPI000A08FEAA|nr:hypothetical protein [Streptomyces sp. Amel2xC10]SMF23556.1 hypothetical protein SAMN02745830_02385 [Streptomyces sp. Amel2xC10]